MEKKAHEMLGNPLPYSYLRQKVTSKAPWQVVRVDSLPWNAVQCLIGVGG